MYLLVTRSRWLLAFPPSLWLWSFRARHACSFPWWSWVLPWSYSQTPIYVFACQSWKSCLQVWMLTPWKSPSVSSFIYGSTFLLVWCHLPPLASIPLPLDDIWGLLRNLYPGASLFFSMILMMSPTRHQIFP